MFFFTSLMRILLLLLFFESLLKNRSDAVMQTTEHCLSVDGREKIFQRGNT
jgi:hypothetical protein